MVRKGIYFKLKPGARPGYVKAHEQIWPEMRRLLDEAGFRNYSIWNTEEKLFAYYELEDEVRTESILHNSSIYQKWRDQMEEYVYLDPQTGQKEWPMEMVFYHKGI